MKEKSHTATFCSFTNVKNTDNNRYFAQMAISVLKVQCKIVEYMQNAKIMLAN